MVKKSSHAKGANHKLLAARQLEKQFWAAQDVALTAMAIELKKHQKHSILLQQSIKKAKEILKKAQLKADKAQAAFARKATAASKRQVQAAQKALTGATQAFNQATREAGQAVAAMMDCKNYYKKYLAVAKESKQFAKHYWHTQTIRIAEKKPSKPSLENCEVECDNEGTTDLEMSADIAATNDSALDTPSSATSSTKKIKKTTKNSKTSRKSSGDHEPILSQQERLNDMDLDLDNDDGDDIGDSATGSH